LDVVTVFNNSKSSIHFALALPNGEHQFDVKKKMFPMKITILKTYSKQLSANPIRGNVAAGSALDIQLQFTLLYTTKVHRFFTVTFDDYDVRQV
jgi:hypothetical protein